MSFPPKYFPARDDSVLIMHMSNYAVRNMVRFVELFVYVCIAAGRYEARILKDQNARALPGLLVGETRKTVHAEYKSARLYFLIKARRLYAKKGNYTK